MAPSGEPIAGIHAESGTYYIRLLQQIARDDDAPDGTRKDWEAVQGWLGTAELSPEHEEAVNRAWLTYLSIGVAPSIELQPTFDGISAQFKAAGKNLIVDRPPQRIMEVFDRLLATDSQISHKRRLDISAETLRFAKIVAKIPGQKRPSWWRRQSGKVRTWIFVSVVWAIGVFVILAVFDPLGVGDWDWADDLDYLKAGLLMLLPAIAGVLKWAYEKSVR